MARNKRPSELIAEWCDEIRSSISNIESRLDRIEIAAEKLAEEEEVAFEGAVPKWLEETAKK